MPNLFPENLEAETEIEREETEETEALPFGRSWKFDFEKGDFVMDPVGRVVEAEPIESWVEWCKKALQTERYKYLIYSDDIGQEFNDLIELGLTREANESEIERMVTECLMVDPRTERVDNFSFQWEKDKVYFSFDVYNVLGEGVRLEDSVVMS